MAREGRHTEPVETKLGRLSSFQELNQHLADGEVGGRTWLLARAKDPVFAGKLPTDVDILAMHKVMFEPLFDWAGQTRTKDVGPGLLVFVPWPDVRSQLLNLTLDAQHWFPSTTVSLGLIAAFIAQLHHRFERLHPFVDTNGRTGRVLDHYVLWVTFGLCGADLGHSPVIEYFPTSEHEENYYRALRAADAGDLQLITEFYVERVGAAFGAVG
jgi:fido (protein-threonine AMPylation protein)